MFQTGIYDSLFKTIILENNNFDYVKEVIFLITKLKINDLTVLNNEILVKKKTNRKTRVDALLRCDCNLVLIEMNKNYYKGLNNRNYHNLYQSGNYLYATGEKDFKDRKLILISFDNYDYYKKGKLIYRINPKEEQYTLIDNKNLEIYRINLTYLERLCYNKSIESLSKLERYLLILLIEDEKLRKQIESGDEILKKVNQKIEEYNADEFNNIFHYDADAELKAIREYEYEQGVEQGIERGIEQGIERGIERGIEQEKFNIAKNMLNNEIPIDLIAKITNLDKDYITTL